MPNPAIFREYDIRGAAERDFDAAFAHSLGRGYAAYITERGAVGRGRIGVGRDCRLTSDAYAAEIRRGLLESGLEVIDLGTCPTPVCYFALFELDLDGAIQVTGSHNPAEDNGFKICVGRSTIHGSEIQALRRHIESGSAPQGRGRVETVDINARYHAYLTSHLRAWRPIHAVVDAGNATAGLVAADLPPARLHDRRAALQPRRPLPESPSRSDRSRTAGPDRAVRATGAEIGLAFDGDADRLGVVDRTGRVVWGTSCSSSSPAICLPAARAPPWCRK
jgi:phosphomannomutase